VRSLVQLRVSIKRASCVVIGLKLGRKFNVDEGLCQGCVMSHGCSISLLMER
jgi:hypothetical protein